MTGPRPCADENARSREDAGPGPHVSARPEPHVGAGSGSGAEGRRRHDLLVVIVVVVYGAVGALAEPMSSTVHVVVTIPVLVVLAAAIRRGWHRFGRPGPRVPITRAGAAPLVVWGLLIAVFAAVQLGHFFSEPRSVYPTLSSLLEEPLTSYPVRVLAFAAWAWLGWFLVGRAR